MTPRRQKAKSQKINDMKRKLVLLVIIVCFISRIACASILSGPSPENSSRGVVDQLFVQRVNRLETFNYFVFWGLDAVKSYFDESLLREYTKFKEQCEKQYPPWGKWSKDSGVDLGTFPVYARNDPLTMCAQKPLKIKVAKLEEDETSAIYKVRYVLQGNAEPYFSEGFVMVRKKNGKWFLSAVTTVQYDNMGVNCYSFVPQLKLLREKLRGEK